MGLLDGLRFARVGRGDTRLGSRKPSSVHPRDGWMVIYLGRRSPDTSCGPPAARAVRAGPRRLFGLAPTGGCRATTVTSRAVGSYPTVSPLPVVTGGLFSVALSVAFQRPGVTWQSALWSSDFPRLAGLRAATITLHQLSLPPKDSAYKPPLLEPASASALSVDGRRPVR